MIGFNLLGNLGRLGNQMFQYASLKGIASNNNLEWIIPGQEIFGSLDPNVRNNNTSIYKAFKLESVKNTGFIDGNVIEEKHFHFDENLFNNCSDNISLNGYLQSEKYFKHIENEIRKDFTFKDEIYNLSKNSFRSLNSSEVISLHIRRGDYVYNPNHPVQTLDYYINALNYFEDNLLVIIFSDDPSWVKSQKIFESDRFLVSDGGDTYIDLCLMSLCKYHIIANSSYSWWGAWLAKSKKVISPKEWFSGINSHKDTKDIYCDDWIII
jgi:hypothetical protein